MAKRLLLNILVDVLGDYIEGLTEENLKVGVWSGNIELKNLSLNRSILNKLNLPITINHGSVQSLVVNIPWTALESNPVKVFIDGVFLLVGPVDLSRYGKDDLKKQDQDLKRVKLLAAEKAVERAALNKNKSEKDSDSSFAKNGYIQRLTTKIIDNIEITLRNVHIRYEDNLSIPGYSICAGITLESFSVLTTDCNGNIAFVKRDLNTNEISIHKLAILQNLGIYWDDNQSFFSHLCNDNNNNSLQEYMLKTIYTEANITPNISNYLMSLPNKMTLNLIHNEHFPDTTPKLDINLDCASIKFVIDYNQYNQSLMISQAYNQMEIKRKLLILKPTVGIKGHAKEWWHYVYYVVSGSQVKSSTHQVFISIRILLLA